jgi:hypothetical protein
LKKSLLRNRLNGKVRGGSSSEGYSRLDRAVLFEDYLKVFDSRKGTNFEDHSFAPHSV